MRLYAGQKNVNFCASRISKIEYRANFTTICPCAFRKHTWITFILTVNVFLIEDKTDRFFSLLKFMLCIILLKHAVVSSRAEVSTCLLKKENVRFSKRN